MESLSLALDFVLIGLLLAGIVYAIRLTRQLAVMRASHKEMERFILDFTATVDRAEAGIKGLKTAARSSGDDLEKLIDKAHGLRDELHFLVESADQIATRLSSMGSAVARAASAPQEKVTPAPAPASTQTATTTAPRAVPEPASKAEKDLLRALSKIG